MNLPVPPRIIASIAIDGIRCDLKNSMVGSWTHNAVGKLSACNSITQDWEILGWYNEAWFLSGNYCDRHNKRW